MCNFQPMTNDQNLCYKDPDIWKLTENDKTYILTGVFTQKCLLATCKNCHTQQIYYFVWKCNVSAKNNHKKVEKTLMFYCRANIFQSTAVNGMCHIWFLWCRVKRDIYLTLNSTWWKPSAFHRSVWKYSSLTDFPVGHLHAELHADNQ